MSAAPGPGRHATMDTMTTGMRLGICWWLISIGLFGVAVAAACDGEAGDPPAGGHVLTSD